MKTNLNNASESNVLDFNTIYNKYYSVIFNYINLKLNYKQVIAEELTNDVFLKAYEHLSSFDPSKGKVLTWLLTIATNKITDNWRTLENRNKANTTLIDSFVDENGKEFFQIADDSSETDSYTIGIEINTSVSEAMNSLKPQYKRVAELRFIECRDYAEIAEIMGISMDNVKVSVKRCKEMLQNKLQNTYAYLKA